MSALYLAETLREIGEIRRKLQEMRTQGHGTNAQVHDENLLRRFLILRDRIIKPYVSFPQ